jgi:hypothetical protein
LWGLGTEKTELFPCVRGYVRPASLLLDLVMGLFMLNLTDVRYDGTEDFLILLALVEEALTDHDPV